VAKQSLEVQDRTVETGMIPTQHPTLNVENSEQTSTSELDSNVIARQYYTPFASSNSQHPVELDDVAQVMEMDSEQPVAELPPGQRVRVYEKA